MASRPSTMMMMLQTATTMWADILGDNGRPSFDNMVKLGDLVVIFLDCWMRWPGSTAVVVEENERGQTTGPTQSWRETRAKTRQPATFDRKWNTMGEILLIFYLDDGLFASIIGGVDNRLDDLQLWKEEVG